MKAIQFLAYGMLIKFMAIVIYLIGFAFLMLESYLIYFIFFGIGLCLFICVLVFDVIFIYKALVVEK